MLKVSVYITTYNREEKISRAINSVLNQSYSDIEIIVVDDASTDMTQKRVLEFVQNHHNIIYKRLEKNSGANVARNMAIKSATGYFITGLDDDDEMVQNRIETLVNAYENDLAFVCADTFIQYNKKRIIKQLTKKDYFGLSDTLYENIVGNQVLTTKKKFLEVGLFDEKLLAAQDFDMWIRLLQGFKKAKKVHQPLQILYVGHSSITLSKNKFIGYLQVYRKHKLLFSKDQRKYWLLNFYYWRNKKISFLTSYKLLPTQLFYLLKSCGKILKVNFR